MVGLTLAQPRVASDSVTPGGVQPGPLEDDAELVADPRRPLDVVPHRDVLVEGDPDRPERAQLGRQPVADPLALGLVGAEQAVPDDQDAAVVAVEVLLVGAVVDAVVGRRVEDRLEPGAAACGSSRCGSRTGRSATRPGRAAPSRARTRPPASRARTAGRSSAPRSGAAPSRGCSAGSSGGRRGSPRTRGSRARSGGTSSRRSRRRRTAAPRPTSRRGRAAAASARRSRRRAARTANFQTKLMTTLPSPIVRLVRVSRASNPISPSSWSSPRWRKERYSRTSSRTKNGIA